MNRVVGIISLVQNGFMVIKSNMMRYYEVPKRLIQM